MSFFSFTITEKDNSNNINEAEHIYQTHDSVTRTKRDGNSLTIWSTAPEHTLYKLFGFTKNSQYRVEHLSIREMSLEDVFIAFTGKEWRD